MEGAHTMFPLIRTAKKIERITTARGNRRLVNTFIGERRKVIEMKIAVRCTLFFVYRHLFLDDIYIWVFILRIVFFCNGFVARAQFPAKKNFSPNVVGFFVEEICGHFAYGSQYQKSAIFFGGNMSALLSALF